MYLMNSDGTIKSRPQQTHVAKEDYNHLGRRTKRSSKKPVHEFNLFKRHPECECTNCWKNFALTIVFYVIIIYIIYLIVKYIFSRIETQTPKTLTTPELPTTMQ